MSYAAILTHVEIDGPGLQRLQLAADLANQFSAALIGVGAEVLDPPESALGHLDGEPLVAQQVIKKHLKLAGARFAEVAKTVRAGSDWRCGVGRPGDLVASHARACDLIVAGPRHAEPFGLHNRVDAGELLMRSGRPVLVVPPGLDQLYAASVVVAWKDTREARRALTDAMPMLKRATNVLVLEIREAQTGADPWASVADVAAHLKRHGVDASTAVREPELGSPGPTLLDMAEVRDADLIVAGGYGRSRLSEWAFGGVTRELLAGPLPVLLSH
jgi:nucleotide-binding universal stress UspA family protein